MSSLQHQHFLARTREVGSIYQSVVSATNDDDVVFIVHASKVWSEPERLHDTNREENAVIYGSQRQLT